jgi:putative inorganic carbon (HCO3(-)) transporter
MDPAGALGEIAEKLGVVVASASAAAALVTPRPTLRAAAMACAASVAAAVLVGHIWDSDQFRSISGDAAVFATLLVLGLAAVAGMAWAFTSQPALFPLLAVGVLPFRVPIDAGGSTSNLLVPLYFVIAGGVGAFVWRELRSRSAPAGRHPGALQLALAAFLALYALQTLYSRDFETALEQVVFFYVPFALLFQLLAEVRWTRSLLAGCGAVLVGLALAFSGIGFWEYAHRELLWNPKLISSNQFASYFRVNSVFWDPNVYGRFLAIVMLIVAASMLWSGSRRVAIAAAAVLAVLWGGLVLTFSQSSLAALIAGLALLAALRWNARRTALATVATAALAAIFLLAFQSTLRVQLGSSSGLNKATSGRVDLVQGGLELFSDRPLWGYGSGSFARSFRLERKGNQAEAVSASHTLPITVAAEQGVIGLAAYAAVLAASLFVLLGRGGAVRAPPEEDRRDGALPISSAVAYTAARAGLAAAYTTLVVHTMMYAAFLEDPFTWVILGTAAAIAPYAAGLERPSRVGAPTAEAAPSPA